MGWIVESRPVLHDLHRPALKLVILEGGYVRRRGAVWEPHWDVLVKKAVERCAMALREKADTR